MSRINYWVRIPIVFVALLFMSCEHKDLDFNFFNSVKVRIIFDWRKAPHATPESMRLYLFPESGGQPQICEFSDFRGGYVSLPPGHYKALCVNSDTESVFYRGIDFFDSFEAYAPDGFLNVRSFSAPRVRGTSQERIVRSPDRLYGSRLEETVIERRKEEQTITLYPELSVCRYRVRIINVANLNHVLSDGILGALTGMSGGLLVGKNQLTPGAVTVPFNVASDGKSTLTADFLTFGQTDSVNLVHKLVIYVILSNGNKYSYTFDVTRQVDEATNPRDVYILLDGLILPEAIAEDNGFAPTIDEWQNIELEIPM